MEKVKHEVSYRVTDQGSYVEVMLFVVQHFGGETEVRVAQEEGRFDNMDDARPLVDYLESIGAPIEYRTIGSQTE